MAPSHPQHIRGRARVISHNFHISEMAEPIFLVSRAKAQGLLEHLFPLHSISNGQEVLLALPVGFSSGLDLVLLLPLSFHTRSQDSTLSAPPLLCSSGSTSMTRSQKDLTELQPGEATAVSPVIKATLKGVSLKVPPRLCPISDLISYCCLSLAFCTVATWSPVCPCAGQFAPTSGHRLAGCSFAGGSSHDCIISHMSLYKSLWPCPLNLKFNCLPLFLSL